MSLAEKHGHGAGETHDWSTPMLMACNHFPSWKTASEPDAIANRSMIFKHTKVINIDPTLPQQLKQQMAHFMYRAAWTYRTLAAKYPVLDNGVPGMSYFNSRSQDAKSNVAMDSRFIAEAINTDTTDSTPSAHIRHAYDAFRLECSQRERNGSSWRRVRMMLADLGREEVNGVFEHVALLGRYADMVQDGS